ncbi:MAG TPA: TonB-dependent receptor [Acidobacteriaceae bacterium]
MPGISANASGGQGSGLSANGGRQRSNSVLVDGVENNDILNGTIRQTISLDAISQFQVMTNQFLPEYGQAAGAIINLITKSGTERVHGDIYYFVRNPALNAKSGCNADGTHCSATGFYRNDFGATLGGPIYKDKTFLFASGEYIGQSSKSATFITQNSVPWVNLALASNYVVGTSVKSVDDGGVYNSFPETLASIRIDHTINDRNTLLYRFLYAHYNNANPSIDSNNGGYSDYSNYGRDNLQAYSMMGEWTHIFSPALLNEAHFQFAPQNLVQLPNASGPTINVSSDIEFGPNTVFPTYLNETHYEWIDALTWIKANHLFKFGTDEEYIRSYTSYPAYFSGYFSFSNVCVANATNPLDPTGPKICPAAIPANFPQTCSASSVSTFSCGFPYEFIQSFGNPAIHLNDKLLSFYAQDQWKLTPRLSLNYGLRYDLDFQPQGYNLNMSDPVQAPLPKGIPRDYNNFAPRIGFAWSLDRKGDTVLRGGYGMFYDKIFLILGRDVLLSRISLEELDPSTATPAQMMAQWKQGPYPMTYNYPSSTIANSLPPSIDTITAKLPIPVTHQATLFVDHALTKDWELEVGGVFTSGQHLLRSNNTNLAPPVILTLANTGVLGGPALSTANPPKNTSQDYSRPYFGGSRINSSYNNITAYGSYGHSTYSALRSSLVHRVSHGLTLRASYIWSKAIDDGSDFTVEPSNPYYPQGDKGLSTQDQRNLFIGSTVYRFPYTMHRRRNSPMRWVLGSWTGSIIFIQGSGRPRNITTGTDSNDDGSATDRPFINGTNGVCTYDAVACPNAGATPIMASRNSFRGPRQVNNQARLQKDLLLPRNSRLTFTAEAFNAINHPAVASLNSYWGNSVAPSSSFGTVQTIVAPRSFQLGMKYKF